MAEITRRTKVVFELEDGREFDSEEEAKRALARERLVPLLDRWVEECSGDSGRMISWLQDNQGEGDMIASLLQKVVY